MRKTELTDEALCDAVTEIKSGLIDADLGGGVIKKRVAVPGRGKRGSTRTLLATNKNNRWFFMFGFEKSERGNISYKELEALQKNAADYLALGDAELAVLIENHSLEEICHEQE